MPTLTLAALTDAVLYLNDYRFDSVDGYASRLLAVSSLRAVLIQIVGIGDGAIVAIDPAETGVLPWHIERVDGLAVLDPRPTLLALDFDDIEIKR